MEIRIDYNARSEDTAFEFIKYCVNGLGFDEVEFELGYSVLVDIGKQDVFQDEYFVKLLAELCGSYMTKISIDANNKVEI